MGAGRGRPTPTHTSSWKDSSESLNFSKETDISPHPQLVASSVSALTQSLSSQGQENGERQRSSPLWPAFRRSPRMYLSGFHSPLKTIEQRKVYKRAFQVEGIEWAKSQKQESTRNFIEFCHSAGIFTGLPAQSLLPFAWCIDYVRVILFNVYFTCHSPCQKSSLGPP